jgi:hypothetical protein
MCGTLVVIVILVVIAVLFKTGERTRKESVDVQNLRENQKAMLDIRDFDDFFSHQSKTKQNRTPKSANKQREIPCRFDSLGPGRPKCSAI